MNKFIKTKMAIIVSLIVNIILTLIKGFIAFLTGSNSMIADFYNSLTDIFSSLMTFIGAKIASVPKDEDHNLGHGKAEYIFSLLISIMMGAMALNVLKTSVLSLINKTTYEFSIWLVIVCLITIISKILLYLYTSKVNKRNNNILIYTLSKDHLNDSMLTTLNLFACLLSLKKIYFIDSIVGIIISLFILISAIKIFRTSYDVLMDKSLPKHLKGKVYRIINSYPEIHHVNHFNSTPIGYLYQVSFTIFVNGNLSTFESHDIADRLEKEINKKIPEISLTVIHVNPLQVEKDNKKKLKRRIYSNKI